MGLDLLSEFCTSESIAHGEPIVGTAAASTSVWLAIEIRGAWPHDALASEEIPSGLRDALSRWKAAIPGFRPQAIRRPGRCSGPVSVFIAVTGGATPRLVSVAVDSLEALGELDLAARVAELRAGVVVAPLQAVDTPTVWVCTHGKRDRCCAKWGVPVFEALAARPGLEVWQTSHLGGHRFAATALCLPHGVCYGRLGLGDVLGLSDGLAAGEVFAFDKLRGRTCWSSAAQAAAHFVRVARGVRTVDGIEIEAEQPTDAGVTVRVRAQGESFEVAVSKRPLGAVARPSCAKDPAPVAGWVLDGFASSNAT